MLRRLKDLLAPVSAESFLARIYGRAFHHIPGQAEKVAGLFSWQDLNLLLSHHRFDTERCRLVRRGTLCSPETYRRLVPNRRGSLVPRLQPAAVMEHLRHGATLILDAVDEMVRPIGILAENLGRELHEEVQVNAYASWGEEPGYGPHFDSHDVLVVQVAGRKHWRVDGPASVVPAFDAVIEAGDVLYLPHRWVHEVTSVAEPSLHLTVGIEVRNGGHLLDWMIDRLKEDELFQQHLPRFRDPEEGLRHGVRLKRRLDLAWRGDVVQAFFDHRDGHVPMRPHHSLPWVGQGPHPDLAGSMLVRFAGTTWRQLEDEDGGFHIQVDGRSWRWPAAAEAMLVPLLIGEPRTVTDLVRSAVRGMAEDDARAILGDLLREGLLFVARA